jgi:hypothetical protein
VRGGGWGGYISYSSVLGKQNKTERITTFTRGVVRKRRKGEEETLRLKADRRQNVPNPIFIAP